MILYYAAGGGLGHLTRARAVIHTLGLADVAIASASAGLHDRRVTGDARLLPIAPELAGDRGLCSRWLRDRIAEMRPDALYIDTFPVGLLGELDNLPAGLPLVYVARRLRWDVYRAAAPGALPRFAGVLRVEELDARQEAEACAGVYDVRDLVLRDPPAVGAEVLEARAELERLRSDGAPLWLVVHSEPWDEVMTLLDYARDIADARSERPRIVVITTAPGAAPSGDPAIMNFYPAHALFDLADRIVTACGFNAMRQASPWRDRHHSMPFPRRYDDQFHRAASARAAIRRDAGPAPESADGAHAG